MAERHGDVEAIVLGDVRSSYGELRQHVDRVACALLGRGLNKGDHIAILMGNRPEWIVCWLAINRIGAVAVGYMVVSNGAVLHSAALGFAHVDLSQSRGESRFGRSR